MALRDRKHQLADAPRRERVGRDPSSRCVHGVARGERTLERRRSFRLDGDDFDAARVPGGDAADMPAAADRDEQRIEAGRLLLKLQADAALAEQRLRLVEGVHGKRARLRDIGFARGERVGVELAADREIGAVLADARDLGRRGNARQENLRRDAKPHGGVAHRDAVIAARSRADARRRNPTHQEIGEGAARLERAGVLHELEFERERHRIEAEVAAVRFHHRRAPDVRPYQLIGRRDAVAVNRVVQQLHEISPHLSKFAIWLLWRKRRQPCRRET
jgi:hypothetical protein